MTVGYKFPILDYDGTVDNYGSLLPTVITIFYTTTGQYTVTIPSNFGSLVKVEAIGAGGGAGDRASAGGGAYAMSNNVTGLVAGGTAFVRVGIASGSNDGVTSFFNTSNSQPTVSTTGCLADSGKRGVMNSTAGAGGTVNNSVGVVRFAGGSGALSSASGSGTGGGAAAGPLGAGGNGGGATGSGDLGMGGGGGSNGGANGGTGTDSVGGVGGNGFGNGVTLTGGGSPGPTSSGTVPPNGVAGTGGGGAGAFNTSNNGGNGATGSYWTQSSNGATAGSGGGGGGASNNSGANGGAGGLYGGGAGGGGNGLGGQGIVVLTYLSTNANHFKPKTLVDMDDMFVKQDYFLDAGLYAWGSSAAGQLGDGTTISKSSPIQIGTLTNWNQVYAGDFNSFGIKTDGTLWAWGSGGSGALGDGTTINKSSPIIIGADTDWKQISKSGGASILALKTYGTLWSWGENNVGQLGSGTTINRSSPVQIGNQADWKYVEVGGTGSSTLRSLALKYDGSLWTWGANESGQLGDGTTINKSSPIQVGTSYDWKYAVASGLSTFAIKTNGTLWAWGNGANGTLGDGTTTSKSTPILIGTNTNWKQVASRYTSVYAVKNDGSLWSWGANESGQLGSRTTISRSSPVQVGLLNEWKFVDAGGRISTHNQFAAAVKTNGTLWAWGFNSSGQLGDGTTINKSSPIIIGADTSWKKIQCSANHIVAIESPDLP